MDDRSPRLVVLLTVAGIGLAQVASGVLNLSSAVYEQRPSLVGGVVAALLVVEWVALGIIMGWHSKRRFLVVCCLAWGGAIILTLGAFPAYNTGSTILETLGMVVIFLLAVPCYPISWVFPIRGITAVVAAMFLVGLLSLGGYAISSALRRQSSRRHADVDPSQELDS